jgi:hypothetical protein
LNPAPLGSPFLPFLGSSPFWVYLFTPRPGNPSDGAREGIPCFDARNKIVAEEGGVGDYSDEVFAEMSEN